MAPSVILLTAAAAAILASVGIVSAVPCVGDCVGDWQQCGGTGTEGVSECCNDGFFCYSLDNDFVDYRQCRRENSVASGWVIPPMDCDPEPPLEDPNVMCAEKEDAHPVDVEIGEPFTIATTTTISPDLAFCVVVNSTMAPVLPLTGTVFASESHITRTLMCTVGKDNKRVECKFQIRLIGEPNVGQQDVAMAELFDATPEDPPEDIILIV